MEITWQERLLSRRWFALPPVLVGVATVVAFARSRAELPRSEVAEQRKSVPAIVVSPEAIAPEARGFGTASSAHRWAAVAEVQGRIVEIHPDLESGNTVPAGELLVRIDATDLELTRSQRRADHESALARLEELEAGFQSDQQLLVIAEQQLKYAVLEEQRLQRIQQSLAVTQSEVERAASDRLVQEQAIQGIRRSLALYPSQIRSAKASIALAEAKVREADRDLERTCIYSPFAGVLSGVTLEVGQFVSTHQLLFELLDDRQIEVVAHFSLEQIAKLTAGSAGASQGPGHLASSVHGAMPRKGLSRFPFTAQVTARSGGLTRTWEGKPVRIAESLNEQSRTMGVVVRVINPPSETESLDPAKRSYQPTGRDDLARWASVLRPGTFCEVVLESPPRSGLIAVPRAAISGDTVFVIDGEDRLRPRRVATGFAFADSITVTSGLAKGDIIAAVAPVPAIAGQLVDPQLGAVESPQLEVATTATQPSPVDTEER